MQKFLVRSLFLVLPLSAAESWALPPCPKEGFFTGTSKWHNCQGTYTFGANSHWAGDKYVGEFRDDQPNGQGTFTWRDGRVEEGIWENNEFLYAKKVTPRKSPPVIPATPTVNNNLDLNSAKKECAELGFKAGTEKFGECVLQLLR